MPNNKPVGVAYSDPELTSGTVLNAIDGGTTTGAIRIGATTAPAAGGSTTGPVLLFGSASNFGIYVGSGAPTIAAGQGSLYLRTDGSSTSTRLYVNTTGSTTWTNFTSAA